MVERVFAAESSVAFNSLIEVLALRTPTLPPATHTNTFLVGSGELVFVEPASPYADEIERVIGWLQTAEQAGKKIKAILLTHHHPDHAGGACELAERTGLPLWAHEKTAELLADEVTITKSLHDGELIELDGPQPCALRAVFTPGHAPGHLCFLEEDTRVMIAGDMVASVGTIIIDPDEGDMAEYLESLRKMKALVPSALLPAHGHPIGDPAAKIDEYIAHRMMREERVLEALVWHERAATLAELLPDVYRDVAPMLWPLAERSLLSHLKKLHDEGRVETLGDRWRLTITDSSTSSRRSERAE